MAKRREGKGRTVFPFVLLKMSSSTRTSSALTASLFGSSLRALWRSVGWVSGKVEHRVIGWQRTVMGLAELLEWDASLRSAKECLHVRFGQAEDGGTVTLGVFIPGLV